MAASSVSFGGENLIFVQTFSAHELQTPPLYTGKCGMQYHLCLAQNKLRKKGDLINL